MTTGTSVRPFATRARPAVPVGREGGPVDVGHEVRMMPESGADRSMSGCGAGR